MCQTPPREWAWRGARLLGSKSGREGPVADPQLQGYCPLSPDGSQQDRAVSGITTGLSQVELSHHSEVVPLLPARESGPSQGWECSSVPLPSPLAAELPRRCSWQGDTSSSPPGERDAPRQADTPREGGVQRAQLTQAWSPQPRAHTWAHLEMDTPSFPPHIHTHTHKCSGMRTLRQGDPNHHSACPLPACAHARTHTHGPTRTDAYGASWTHTDLHTHNSSPPSISLGWGQLCSPDGAQTQLGCP